MLKRFFTVFLGSVAAIWFSILVFIAIIFIAAFKWIGSIETTETEPHSILYLNLAGDIPDRATTPTVRDMIIQGGIPEISFDEIVKAIKYAKTDTNIDGIYINLQGASLGLALRQELREVMAEFKKSGKWIVAYADNYSQGDYFTASVADEVYINPSGSVAANGMAVSVPFFKNALDKLGVEIQVIKVGTFKSAVEPFILTQMSDSARMQYDVMLKTMWDGYVADIIADRNLPSDSATMFRNMAATPMTAYTAPEIVSAGLADKTMYAYEVHNLLKTKTGADKKPALVSVRNYLSSFNKSDLLALDEHKDHIAVLYAVGDIVDSGSEGIVGEKMAPLIVDLADDEHVRGLVLRVNSGGGSAFASEQIWASLEYFKSKDKPFVVSMADAAASGGYYISCGADRIYADPATITGSIGIFGIIPYAKKLLNDKLGIDFSIVETNPNAVFPRLDAPLTPDQQKALEKNIHDGYNLFIDRVATGRKMSPEAVRRIAEGRVWAGATAIDIGLVDELGGLNAAMKEMSIRTGLSADNYIEYPKTKATPWEMLLSFTEADVSILKNRELKEAFGIVSRLKNMNAVQARMEDITVR